MCLLAFLLRYCYTCIFCYVLLVRIVGCLIYHIYLFFCLVFLCVDHLCKYICVHVIYSLSTVERYWDRYIEQERISRQAIIKKAIIYIYIYSVTSSCLCLLSFDSPLLSLNFRLTLTYYSTVAPFVAISSSFSTEAHVRSDNSTVRGGGGGISV